MSSDRPDSAGSALPDAMSLETIFHYHELTKHRFERYAPGPGGLDWANQPEPFRRYRGAPLTQFELPAPEEPAATAAAPVNLASLSRFFFDSLAISAWKDSGGNRWALRVNPSSGNLHPTECYLICSPLAGLSDAPGLYHYAPDAHGLEHRGRLSPPEWTRIAAALPPGTFLVGLSSVLWREAWKYGERAFRYCQHDIGHALAALGLASARLGWRARLLDGVSRAGLRDWLGLAPHPGVESEHPDCLLAVGPGSLEVSALGVPSHPPAWEILGTPNRLSEESVTWPNLEEAAKVVFEAPPSEQPATAAAAPSWKEAAGLVYPRRILRARRSAVAMDGETCCDAAQFYEVLRATMPDRLVPGVMPWAPLVHLVVFVHRVTGLDPGVYCLVRNPECLTELRTLCRSEFAWISPPGCPADLPLYLLTRGDSQEAARVICCYQDIASDGCFALGMVARFEEPLRKGGPGLYPRLYWECGYLGQVLYLEAERAGLRGTGIGCFFDDAMHRVLGLDGRAYQSLYHFTVGGPVEDTRITTLPAYPER